MKAFTWISVKDALPEPEANVLVLPEPTNEMDESVCYGFSDNNGLEWVRDYSDGYESYRESHYDEITHWMYDPRDYPPEVTE